MRGKLQRTASPDALLFFASIFFVIGLVLPVGEAAASVAKRSSESDDLLRRGNGLRGASLSFLELRNPLPQTPAAASGQVPVKNLLMHLAAINQKLAEDDEPADGQPDAPAGTSEGSELPQPRVVAAAPVQASASTPPRAVLRRATPVLAQTRGGVEGAQLLAGKKLAMVSGAAAPIKRPQAAAGSADPDVVHFGLFGKTFYGIDLKAQEYTIDSVMTLQWMDSRTVSMVPAGQEEFTFSAAETVGKVWTPHVEITNGAGQRFDHISSSVTVTTSGWVTQVERILAVVKNKFILNDYPFDKQTLRLNVASMQYLSNEVKLTPIGNQAFSGLHKGFFDGEDYIQSAFAVKAAEDVDGPLKKSRGYLQIDLTRSLSRFQRNFLLPAFLYLAISCAVFWLPFSPTFVTPRVALSIFILLIFSNLAANADSELPAGAPYNWIDLFCFTIQLHMFTVLCLNVFTEIAYHSMKCTVTAVHMSNELKIFAPVMAIVSMGVILAASTDPDGALGLHKMTMLMPVTFALFLISYMMCCGSSLSAELAKNKREDALKTQDLGGAGLGPLASSESLAPSPQQ